LIEIDKLKALLLTKNQIRLLDYIPKQTIKLSKEIKASQVFQRIKENGKR
jgi:hypothetical protein